MPGADKIIEKILEDAREQARDNIEKSDQEAAAIREAAKEDIRVKEKDVLDKAYAKAAENKRRLIAVAQLEGRKEKLLTKQEIINEVFKKALIRLSTLSQPEYESFLERVIFDSVKTGDEEIVMSESDAKRLGINFINKINNALGIKGLKGGLTLSQASAELNGGIIIKKGEMEINNSFDAIIRMKRDELEEAVVALLF